MVYTGRVHAWVVIIYWMVYIIVTESEKKGHI